MKSRAVRFIVFRVLLVVGLLPLWVSAETPAPKLKVAVSGVSGAIESNVRLLLEIVALNAKSSYTVRDIKRAHAQAQADIEQATQPFGYYKPVVKSTLVAPREGETNWRASYQIELGPRVLYRHVGLLFEKPELAAPELTALIRDHPFKQDSPLDHAKYKAFKSRLVSFAFNHGYLDARFTAAELRVSEAESWADVEWRFATGPRYHFGEIDIQQSILNGEILNKLVDLPEGEIFRPDRLVAAQLALTDSNYFQSVEIDVRKKEAVGLEVPVTIKATPTAGKRYSTYAGYGTDTGPRIGLGGEYRHINRRGHQLNADIRLSTIKSTLSAEYGIPIGDMKSERLSLFAQAERAEVGDAETDQYSVGARIEDSWLGMRRQLYLILSHENYQFGDGPNRDAELLTPGIGLSWQKVDDPLYTRRGIDVGFDLHGGEQNSLSDTTFVHTTLRTHAVLPLGSRARLLLRAEVGAIWTENFSALPPSQRFFTGGDRSVRGYAFESLSPENAAGDEIGGKYLSAAGVEVDMLLRGNYGMAVFYDVGSAAEEFGQDLHAGVGIGFRYKSPVGLIRVDLAHPLDDPDTDFRLHVTFGPDL